MIDLIEVPYWKWFIITTRYKSPAADIKHDKIVPYYRIRIYRKSKNKIDL